MNRFLALFTGSPDAMTKWMALEEGARKQREHAGMQAWQQWMVANERSLVDGVEVMECLPLPTP